MTKDADYTKQERAALKAIEQHDLDGLKALAQDGLDVKEILPDGSTFLFAATAAADPPVFEWLIEQGVPTDQIDLSGRTLYDVIEVAQTTHMAYQSISLQEPLQSYEEFFKNPPDDETEKSAKYDEMGQLLDKADAKSAAILETLEYLMVRIKELDIPSAAQIFFSAVAQVHEGYVNGQTESEMQDVVDLIRELMRRGVSPEYILIWTYKRNEETEEEIPLIDEMKTLGDQDFTREIEEYCQPWIEYLQQAKGKQLGSGPLNRQYVIPTVHAKAGNLWCGFASRMT